MGETNKISQQKQKLELMLNQDTESEVNPTYSVKYFHQKPPELEPNKVYLYPTCNSYSLIRTSIPIDNLSEQQITSDFAYVLYVDQSDAKTLYHVKKTPRTITQLNIDRNEDLITLFPTETDKSQSKKASKNDVAHIEEKLIEKNVLGPLCYVYLDKNKKEVFGVVEENDKKTHVIAEALATNLEQAKEAVRNKKPIKSLSSEQETSLLNIAKKIPDVETSIMDPSKPCGFVAMENKPTKEDIDQLKLNTAFVIANSEGKVYYVSNNLKEPLPAKKSANILGKKTELLGEQDVATCELKERDFLDFVKVSNIELKNFEKTHRVFNNKLKKIGNEIFSAIQEIEKISEKESKTKRTISDHEIITLLTTTFEAVEKGDIASIRLLSENLNKVRVKLKKIMSLGSGHFARKERVDSKILGTIGDALDAIRPAVSDTTKKLLLSSDPKSFHKDVTQKVGTFAGFFHKKSEKRLAVPNLIKKFDNILGDLEVAYLELYVPERIIYKKSYDSFKQAEDNLRTTCNRLHDDKKSLLPLQLIDELFTLAKELESELNAGQKSEEAAKSFDLLTDLLNTLQEHAENPNKPLIDVVTIIEKIEGVIKNESSKIELNLGRIRSVESTNENIIDVYTEKDSIYFSFYDHEKKTRKIGTIERKDVNNDDTYIGIKTALQSTPPNDECVEDIKQVLAKKGHYIGYQPAVVSRWKQVEALLVLFVGISIVPILLGAAASAVGLLVGTAVAKAVINKGCSLWEESYREKRKYRQVDEIKNKLTEIVQNSSPPSDLSTNIKAGK